MRQAQWDAFQVVRWSQTLRARSAHRPLSAAEKDRIARYVHGQIQEWAELFPTAGRDEAAL